MNDAKYRMLVETLKSNILSGKYGNVNPFPSVRSLIRRYGLSNTTVLHALDELVRQGLISRKQGRGTFVTKKGCSRKIGLIVPSIAGSESFPEFVSAISQISRDNDYTILFSDISYSDLPECVQRTKAFAQSLVDDNVSGVVYLPLEFLPDATERNLEILDIFSKAGVPIVLLDRDVVPVPNRSPYDVVGINGVNVGQCIAEHLLSLGAQRIHFFIRPNCTPICLNRIAGAKIALGNAGINCDEKRDVLVAFPNDVQAVKRHLFRTKPDAFICSSDTVAAQLARTLDTLGVRVPEDLMLVGHNDLQLARVLTPALTTIHSPCAEIAATAFHRLLARMDDPSLPPIEITLPFSLVVRESTRGWCPRKARRAEEKR